MRDIPTCVVPVHGWRFWKFMDDLRRPDLVNTPDGLQLCAIYSAQVWPPRYAPPAKCNCCRRAPVKDCRCGYYAFVPSTRLRPLPMVLVILCRKTLYSAPRLLPDCTETLTTTRNLDFRLITPAHCISALTYECTLKVWDFAKGREWRIQKDHSRSVQGVASSGNGRIAASASRDHMLNVWDVTSSSEVCTLVGQISGSAWRSRVMEELVVYMARSWRPPGA